MSDKIQQKKTAIIYKLCCLDPSITDIYVGSTTNFRTRKNQHKSKCHKEGSKNYNLYVYQFIRNNGGWENWDMIQLHSFEHVDMKTTRAVEREYFEKLGATLNTIYPMRGRDEYLKDPEVKSGAVERCRQWRLDNPEKNKDMRHTYYVANRDELKKKAKLNYEKNKTKINETVQCECGSKHSASGTKRHQKTIKHLKYLKLTYSSPSSSSVDVIESS